MKCKKTVKYLVCSVMFFLMTTAGMCAEDGMGKFIADVAISATSLHEWMPSVTHNPIENEFLVLWHTTGVRVEGGENMYSLHGQRIDPDGNLLGDPLTPLKSIGPERRLLPRSAHNPFTNQYMVSFIMGQEVTEWDPFITILDGKGNTVYEPVAISEELTKANHANIVFNSKRRQYLVVYNDSRNGNADIFGVILDENGNIVKNDFAINTATGDQINAYACYDTVKDRYLINWEDFRNVSTWTEPGDIYGALLDGDGTVLVNDIAMCDDHGRDNEGDQRVQSIAYNSDRDEFLASWWDSRPSLDNEGIVGRIINADGTPQGADFVIDDGPGAQAFPHIIYIQQRGMYFAVWDDKRNDSIPGNYWGEATNRDIYAKWLDPDGHPIGDAIPICTKEGNQRYSEVGYNPLMDRFLITWREEVEEVVIPGGGSGHIAESGGNIMGAVYGVPSFLTGRVVEEGTEVPVEGAKAMIIGIGLLKTETSNSGGWFSIFQDGQRPGKYFIIAYKSGYRTAFTSVDYTGEPLNVTVKIKKR